MELFIERTGKRMRMSFSGTASALLRKLKLSPETVIVVRNSAVVTEDDRIADKDYVEILSVVSGG
jgi:thiamine biosynthesis protein ThiS